MYIFFSNIFQINFCLIQDCSIAQINLLQENDTLEVNEQNIDFRRKASKLGMSLVTNIALAEEHLQTHPRSSDRRCYMQLVYLKR